MTRPVSQLLPIGLVALLAFACSGTLASGSSDSNPPGEGGAGGTDKLPDPGGTGGDAGAGGGGDTGGTGGGGAGGSGGVGATGGTGGEAPAPPRSVPTEYDLVVGRTADGETVTLSLPSDDFYAATRAAPAVEGFGANAKGARADAANAKVRFVTNLKDAGAGSFRAAMETTGAAYVVPLVAGYIRLSDSVKVSDRKTYLGQFVPKNEDGARLDGIALRLHRPALTKGHHPYSVTGSDVITRFLKIYRLYHPDFTDLESNGNCYSPTEAKDGSRNTNLVFDHLNCGFTSDQMIGSYGSKNTTHSNLLTADPIHYDSYHFDTDLSTPGQQDHGYGPFFTAGSFSFYRSLIARVNQRAPYTTYGNDEIADVRNLLLYNNFYGPSLTGKFAKNRAFLNHVGTHVRAGPITRKQNKDYWYRMTRQNETGLMPKVYFQGNYGWKIADANSLDAQWAKISFGGTPRPDAAEVRSNEPFDAPKIKTLKWDEARDRVAHAAGFAWLIDPDTGELVNVRDEFHQKVVDEVVSDTGPNNWLARQDAENRAPKLANVELVPGGTADEMIERFWSRYFEPWLEARGYEGKTRDDATELVTINGQTYALIELFLFDLTPSYAHVNWDEVEPFDWK